MRRFQVKVCTRVLERAMAAYGKPQSIRSDNGPELTSRHYLAWAIEWKIDLLHIQPEKPTQTFSVLCLHSSALLPIALERPSIAA
jgi:transposase InsO family protein